MKTFFLILYTCLDFESIRKSQEIFLFTAQKYIALQKWSVTIVTDPE